MHAALVRARRGERRFGRAAVQELDDRGLLAGGIPARDPGHLDRHRVQARRQPLPDPVLEAVEQAVLGAVDAQVRLAGADRLRRERHPVQHQVRKPAQQQPVLAAGRLSLGAVGHQHLAARSGRDRAHLAAHRETRAAPAGQARGLHHVDEAPGPPQHRHRPVPPLMPRQSRGLVPDAREQAGQPRRPGRRPGRGHGQCGHRAAIRAAATSRQAATASTARAQATVRTNTHVTSRSVPIPRPWATATGQHA